MNAEHTSRGSETNTSKKNAEQENMSSETLGRIMGIAYQMLSIRNMAILAVILALVGISALVYSSKYTNYIGFTNRQEILYLSAVVLIVLYGILFVFSAIYTMSLRRKFKNKYELNRKRIQGVPKIFSVWVLPIISILLVMVAQVSTIPRPDSKRSVDQGVEIEAPSDSQANVQAGASGNVDAPSVQTDARRASDDNDISYRLAFALAVSLMLLMIGMELSYLSQEHQPEHRWSVLVLASLILDFASYFILIVGFSAPDQAGSIHEMKSTFTFTLGVASLVSSYFAITQARITDEVLGSRAEG